jgi:biofilm PGA synthesis N-glycosyltransferase PgaC
MDVTVGVMAYNEEEWICGLLDSLLGQRLRRVRIREVIVVSSGSTDRTNDIVMGFCRRDRRIRLVREPERRGKSRAISRFLRLAKTEIVVLSNADIVLERDAVERLCEPLFDGRAGISVARPVSLYGRNSFIGYTNNIVWEMWHSICAKCPKYGELMAFRRLFPGIGDTSVDEEFIGMLFARRGMKPVYVPGAVFYNTGPRTLKGFMRQRRRVFAGHLFLKKGWGHEASTMGFLGAIRALRDVGERRVVWIALAMVIEALGRALGFYDYVLGREEIVWNVAR